MPDKQDEILNEVKELKSWLYGREGHTGDIPEIKAGLKNHDKRIRRIELIIVGLLILGSGTIGIINLVGG